MASAYTKGCSDLEIGMNCLGVSRMEKKTMGWWWMGITLTLSLVELTVGRVCVKDGKTC